MEYLVQTSGKVSQVHNKAYFINAETLEEAQEIAKENFKQEFACNKVKAEAKSFTRTKRAIMACAMMLIAIVISMFPYKQGFLKSDIVVRPDLKSCVYAIVFYAVYIIRFKGIGRAVETYLDIIFTIFNVLLLSTFFRIILDVDKFELFKMASDKLVLITIVASMLGVKLVSVACMIFVAFTAVSNLISVSNAMGFPGVIYIMCAFLGFLLYLSVEPAVLEAFPQMKSDFSKTFKIVKNDFSEAKDEAKSITNKVLK